MSSQEINNNNNSSTSSSSNNNNNSSSSIKTIEQPSTGSDTPKTSFSSKPSPLSSSSSSSSTTSSDIDNKNTNSESKTSIEISNGDKLTSSNSILILLLRPTGLESNPLNPRDEIVRVNYLKSKVIDLKSLISRSWRGKPKVEGIRLIAKGRILNDNELLGPALSLQPGDSSTHPVHVVIRPNAWTEALPLRSAPQRPLSAPPLAAAEAGNSQNSTNDQTNLSAAPQLPPFGSLGGNAQSPVAPLLFNLQNPNQQAPTSSSNPTGPGSSSSQLLWTYFSSLSREQRPSFVENLLKAQFCVVERLEVLRNRLYLHQVRISGLQPSGKDVEDLEQQTAKEQDESWSSVDQNLSKLLSDLQYWGTFEEQVAESKDASGPKEPQLENLSEFVRVEVSGMPFLLYLPKSFQTRRNQDDLNEIKSREIKEFQNTKKQLNRVLHLDSSLSLLIVQTRKIESTLNQMELLMSMNPAQVFGAAGFGPMPRFPSGANAAAGPRPNLGYEYPNYGYRPNNANPYNGAIPPQPNANFAHALNPNGIPPPPGGPGAVAGFGFGVANGGMFPFQPNLMNPNGQPWTYVMPRVRRYEFTINLDSIRRYMAPLLWLSLKLSFLLYIFGRHASFNKRAILVGMAVGWVLWEAFAISQRHEAQNRRRERVQRFQQAGGQGAGAGAGPVDPVQAVLDRGRRRAERERERERIQQRLREQRQQIDAITNQINRTAPANANDPPARPATPNVAAPDRPAEGAAAPVANTPAINPAPVPAPAPAPQPPRRNGRQDLRAAAADIRARGGAFPPGTEVRPFRTTSALSPKYWFNSIAVVGLASEYRELGLHPIGERTMGSSNSEYPRWYKYMRNFKTCIVLFIGTLLPEIEKKRKKALEKRSRILNVVLADAAREREGVANEAQAAGSTPGRTTIGENQAQASGSDVSSGGPNRSVEQDENQATPRVVSQSNLQHTPPNFGKSTLVHRTPRGSDSADDVTDETFNRLATPRASSSNSLRSDKNPKGCGRPSPENSVTPVKSVAVPRAISVPKSSSQAQDVPKEGEPSSNEAIVGDDGSSDPTGTTTTTATSAPVKTMTTSGTETDKIIGSESGPTAPVTNGNVGTGGGNLDSPLTPLNEQQVVGGLDDTDDEEMIGGGEEEEAGMMLF